MSSFASRNAVQVDEESHDHLSFETLYQKSVLYCTYVQKSINMRPPDINEIYKSSSYHPSKITPLITSAHGPPITTQQHPL